MVRLPLCAGVCEEANGDCVGDLGIPTVSSVDNVALHQDAQLLDCLEGGALPCDSSLFPLDCTVDCSVRLSWSAVAEHSLE